MTVYFKSGLLYFLIVFAAGFVLGVIRVLALEPALGTGTAELLEMPVMVGLTVCAARWVVRHFQIPITLGGRLVVGMLALLLLLGAELGVAIGLRGLSVSEAILDRDPISGMAYLLSLVLFALMPTLVLRRKSAHIDKQTLDKQLLRSLEWKYLRK
jgi:hypothetical protein